MGRSPPLNNHISTGAARRGGRARRCWAARPAHPPRRAPVQRALPWYARRRPGNPGGVFAALRAALGRCAPARAVLGRARPRVGHSGIPPPRRACGRGCARPPCRLRLPAGCARPVPCGRCRAAARSLSVALRYAPAPSGLSGRLRRVPPAAGLVKPACVLPSALPRWGSRAYGARGVASAPQRVGV